MAKLTLDDVGNLNMAGLATINENSSRIEAALENTLSRDGTTPNQMESDLDLNHNDILNVDNLDVDGSFVLNGETVHPDNLVVTNAVLRTDTDPANFDFVSSDPDLSVDTGKLALRGDVLANITAKSVADAEALAPTSAPDFIQTAGYSSAGDGGGALYKKVAAEPSHEGKFSITLDDGVTVIWFEIAEDTIPVKALGAKGDTVSVTATVSISNGSGYLTALGASFTNADVGKLISIPGAAAASGGVLGTTIKEVIDAQHARLTDAASDTLSSESVTIGYGTDDTQALEDAAKVATGRVLWFASGTYSITKAVPVYSKTTVRGVYGASIIQPARKYTGTPTCDGACLRNSTFDTASSLEESDILVEDMAFDYTYRPQGSPVGQGVGVFMRFVERPKVIRCLQWYGGDLSGLLQCKDTQVSDCLAHEVINCPYDHWDGTGYSIVSNNIVRSETLATNQCIQFNTNNDDWGDDPATQSMEKIVVVGNLVDCISKGSTSGIAIGPLHAGGVATDILIADNYVRGPDFSILIQGNVNGFSITDNVIRDVKYRGIQLRNQADETDVFPTNGVVAGNLIIGDGTSSSSELINATYASDILIQNNKLSAPGTWSVHLYADTSNCLVQNNMADAGAGGDILNSGNGNTIVRPYAFAKYSGTTVFSGSPAPSTFTDLDLSTVVGAQRCLVTLRIVGNVGGGSTPKYVFRTNGDTTTEASLSGIGTGANICQMQNGESNNVTVVTDAAGIVEWVSDTTTGTTTVILIAHQPLQ